MSTKLFIEALRDDEQHSNMRLAHLGDLVQNLLLCDIAYTGSSAREDFMETKLKRKVCKNKDQWEMVKKTGFRKFMSYQQTDPRDKRRTHPIRDKRFADTFEAVIGAMYKESRRHWKQNCLAVMRKLRLDFAAAREVVGRQDQEFADIWKQVIANEARLRTEGLWFL